MTDRYVSKKLSNIHGKGACTNKGKIKVEERAVSFRGSTPHEIPILWDDLFNS
jgi:hypothetical protein